MPIQKDSAVLEISDRQDSESPGDKPQAKKRSPMLLAAVASAIVLTVIGTFWWLNTSGREETEDAYVEAHISYLSSRIAGIVTKVLVDEQQPIKTGTLMVVLDSRDQKVKLDEDIAAVEQAERMAAAAKSKIHQTDLSAKGQTSQAEGDISAGEADIMSSRSEAMQTEDKIKQAEDRLKELLAQEEFARADFERYKTVYENRAVTKQQFDKASQNLQVAIAQRQQAEQNLNQCRKERFQAESRVAEAIAHLNKSKGMRTSAEAVTAQKSVDAAQYMSNLASVKRYQAEVDQSKLQLSYTKIYSPVDGRTGKKSVEVGQRVEPGQNLISIVQNDVWIIANYKETQVGKMRVGQPVEIKIDAFPDHTFKGMVDSIGPASGAKFSMLPPDNATGNFTKIVQRIPVKIVFDQNTFADYKGRIAPGMSSVVNVLMKP